MNTEEYETLLVALAATAMFDGQKLFDLKTVHGFPLDFALDKIINQKKRVVCWPQFIKAARKNNWWDFQTYEVICHAMADAEIPKDIQEGFKQGFQRYVLAHPHPKLKENT